MELKIIDLSKDLAVKNETIAGKEKTNIKVGEVAATLGAKAQEVIRSREELDREKEKFSTEKFNREKNDTTKIEYSGNLRGQQGEIILKRLISQSTIYIENKNVFMLKRKISKIIDNNYLLSIFILIQKKMIVIVNDFFTF